MRLSPSILLAVALAGCAMHPSPAAAPVPAELLATASAATDSGVPAEIWDVPGAPVLPPRDTSERDVIPAGAPMAAPAPAAAAAPSHEVTRQVIDVFGDSLFFTPPVLDSAVDEPSWDMDVRSYETRDRVAHYVSLFSGRNKAHLAARLAKGSRYEPMIRAKFKAGGLPEDMYYLAFIESGFDPNAYSRAAAVGMWQFMTSTGRDLGMRIDWWVDERRDPVKSTGAAVRFIRGLRDQFGSLYLAAAAYNGGPGRVARGLAKYSDDLENTQQAEDAFFVLAEKDYLRNETREYVPQLIAAALVAKEPVRYGLELTPLPAFAYDSVKVPGGTPLAAVAKAGRTTVAVIRDLNPQFLRGMTPPGDRMQVRIPVGSATAFDSVFATLDKDDRLATRTVVSRKGETVDHVAEAHGISSAAVESFNPHLRHLKPSGKLVTGQTLILPTPAVAAASAHVPDPSIEKYGSSSSAHLRTHTVARGETVRSIARKFHTTPERIMKLNGLRKPVLFAGQDLIVSGSPRKGGAKHGHHAAGSRGSSKPRTTHAASSTAHRKTAKHGTAGKPAATPKKKHAA